MWQIHTIYTGRKKPWEIGHFLVFSNKRRAEKRREENLFLEHRWYALTNDIMTQNT
jgi:hypothetical protein